MEKFRLSTNTTLAASMLLCGLLAAGNVYADNGKPINHGSANKLTMAVFGDWP